MRNSEMVLVQSRLVVSLVVLGFCIMAVLYLESAGVHNWRVKGNSMEPVLTDGDIIRCKNYTGKGVLARYDIVLVHGITDHISVKCILGLPGDVVRFTKQGVQINGISIAYPNSDGFEFENILGEDEYFVVGTNAENSIDSRFVGAVKRSQIKGRYVGAKDGEYVDVAEIMGW